MACLLSRRDLVSSTFGVAHVLEHHQDCWWSGTRDSFPRQTPGVLLWLDCSWVYSSRQQDHAGFLTASIKHHHAALFCHAGHPHTPLWQQSNRKTSNIWDTWGCFLLVFEDYRKYEFLQLLKSYVAPWTRWWQHSLSCPRPVSVTTARAYLPAPTRHLPAEELKHSLLCVGWALSRVVVGPCIPVWPWEQGSDSQRISTAHTKSF